MQRRAQASGLVEGCIHDPSHHGPRITEAQRVCIGHRDSRVADERGTAWAVESVLSSAVISLAMSPYQ